MCSLILLLRIYCPAHELAQSIATASAGAHTRHFAYATCERNQNRDGHSGDAYCFVSRTARTDRDRDRDWSSRTAAWLRRGDDSSATLSRARLMDRSLRSRRAVDARDGVFLGCISRNLLRVSTQHDE